MYIVVMVEFDPSTYAVPEGTTADIRVALRGQSAIDVGVIFNTEDISAVGELEGDCSIEGRLHGSSAIITPLIELTLQISSNLFNTTLSHEMQLSSQLCSSCEGFIDNLYEQVNTSLHAYNFDNYYIAE